jgi:hypothetical protein
MGEVEASRLKGERENDNNGGGGCQRLKEKGAVKPSSLLLRGVWLKSSLGFPYRPNYPYYPGFARKDSNYKEFSDK